MSADLLAVLIAAAVVTLALVALVTGAVEDCFMHIRAALQRLAGRDGDDRLTDPTEDT